MSDTVSLASGYGSFLTPTVATEAAVRAIRAGQLPLGEAAGLPPLREALARRYLPADGHICLSQVIITPGAKAALFALLRAVLRPGDEVLLLTPNWFGFADLVAQAGATLRELALNPATNYELDPDQLRAALTPRTRVLLFSNPNNPTGRVYHAEALAELLRVTGAFPDLYVLADEIYDLITFGTQPVPSLLDFPDPHGRHLVVNGFSKSLALVGWGVGYLVAPPVVARACAAWQQATGAAVPMPNQHAALAATRAAPGIASGLINQLHRNRQRLLERLAALPQVPPVQPEATYYAFPDLRAYLRPGLPPGKASADLVARLLAAGVEVVDGAQCGAPGFVRLSYAVPEPVLRAGLTHFTHALLASQCLREA
ncbi:pyridoxal phosphate-dependent aminotransferase [Hymenobacter weizhouensis]|uniref:pyridoxal phosphate-dependent aminotransferase n=1 Tax=Hymenobacter sp. YIM 151500-1 TaxID=2987689 RepID=UPI0022260CCE|nr:aminotransferase class I/II-fold pyridoxal phosphate-dependent enzyme [Hymenobacter sp. YIM 151500-1]UYZ63600.1 aminotransferase class I/II-fold pyridoxal phosphate-dependent enzyme [Hymenobacter sp. YIM 151500-1]